MKIVWSFRNKESYLWLKRIKIVKALNSETINSVSENDGILFQNFVDKNNIKSFEIYRKDNLGKISKMY